MLYSLAKNITKYYTQAYTLHESEILTNAWLVDWLHVYEKRNISHSNKVNKQNQPIKWQISMELVDWLVVEQTFNNFSSFIQA